MNKSKYLQEFVENGRLASTYVIDTHTHMGGVYGAHLPISDIDSCVKLMDKENIPMIWCCAHSDLFDPASNNSVTEQAMSKYPGRVKGFLGLNPNYVSELDYGFGRILTNPDYIGFKFLPEYHKYALDGEAYEKALQFADDHNLIVLVHTWGGSRYNAPANVGAVLKKYKNLQFVMGHSAPGECDAAIELAKTYDNVYLDLCDIHRHSGIVEKMVKSAGADKVLFGTDLPWYDPNYCIGSVLCARISDSERDMIFHQNAERMLAKITK